ncbi:MAG: ABC transporter ATP-binding protein [Clostridiales bacterium]|nr:ABC transporter ATP-binding protein [Clostridiales bacterium]
MRVMKYLRGHIPSVVVIVLLLVVQSFCELSLPAYTSRIVDTGIQGGGIESATPLVLTDKTMDGVRLFLSDEDAQTVSDAYTYDNGIWTLGDTARQPELEPVFIRPLVMYARLSEQGANTVLALRRQMQGGLITREEILARGEEALSGMGVLTDSVLRSAAMQFLKTEYAVAGLNVNHIRTSYLLRTGGRMLLLTLGMIAAAVLCSYVGAKMSAAIGRDLRAQVFRKVLSFSSAEMDKFSTASLITRSTNDVTQIQAVCVMLVRIVLYAPIIGLGGVVMVARTKTGLGWVIALAVAAMLLLVGVLMKIAMPQFRAMQQRVDDVNLVSREILTGLPVIRAFHRERHEQERFDTASAALMNTQLFVNRTMAFMGPVMTLIMYGVTVMIEWFGAKSINAGHMQIGDMIAFSSYASMIIMAFMMITIVAVMLPRAEVSAARVDEILHTRPSVRAPRSAEPAPTDATVTFDHVSFRYPGAEDDVLHDVSFTARPGQVTAIVGSTGCGKSTLLNLIPRFYDATGGTVSIGGVDVRRMQPAELRAMLGYVPQKGVLFTGDILSNLEFAGDVSEADAIRAAATAQAEDFIWSRPQHFLTPVAQGGSNVSGGQRQRLSIARAIAKHPQVYLFDDSFSALDYQTDAALRQALARQTHDATVLIVAQRLSTILHAEQILVLDEGRIVGRGTHEELLTNCEVYRQIAKSQLSAKELGLPEVAGSKAYEPAGSMAAAADETADSAAAIQQREQNEKEVREDA